ncbi:MAG TPA: hypothetical protein VD902_01615 [Symbiobacteriaceae bacterium]|nr:hypothetical protein [Symbiobacteriaceae bacterium]
MSSGKAANPWAVLCAWPAWRGLHDSLQELEQLLRLAGSQRASADAAELADSVAALLEDPAFATGSGTYRMAFRAGEKPTGEDGDLTGQLLDWLGQLSRYVTDAPVLLTAPQAARDAGLLAVELPRAWQARLGGLAFQLKQVLRGRGARNGGQPPAGAEYQLPGHIACVIPQDGGYAITLPAGDDPAAIHRAWAELLYWLLADAGPDAARLHLLLLAAAGLPEIACEAVYAALGLHRRNAPTRRERNRRSDAALRRLQGVRITIYRYSAKDRHNFAYDREATALWDVTTRDYGQATLVEQGSGLVTRGEGWAMRPGPGSLAARLDPGEWAGLSRTLLDAVDGRANRLSLSAATLLGCGVTTLPNREVLRLAGVASPDEAIWPKLRAALRLQQHWGWEPDFGQWPREGARLEAATIMNR